MIPFRWQDDAYLAHPDRAVFRLRDATLFIADVHLGKSTTFRAAGIPVPRGTTARDLERLTALLTSTRAERLVILGDLLHARSGRTDVLRRAVTAWRTRHRGLDIVLVRGNHDAHAGDPPASWRVTCVDEPAADAAIDWRHHPPAAGTVARPWLAGHLHPVVRLPGAGGLRAVCLHATADGMVLPAFGTFTGGARVTVEAGTTVIAMRDGAALDISALAGRT